MTTSPSSRSIRRAVMDKVRCLRVVFAGAAYRRYRYPAISAPPSPTELMIMMYRPAAGVSAAIGIRTAVWLSADWIPAAV